MTAVFGCRPKPELKDEEANYIDNTVTVASVLQNTYQCSSKVWNLMAYWLQLEAKRGAKNNAY